jgi:hypothetical protein
MLGRQATEYLPGVDGDIPGPHSLFYVIGFIPPTCLRRPGGVLTILADLMGVPSIPLQFTRMLPVKI